MYHEFRFNGPNVYFTDIGPGPSPGLDPDTRALAQVLQIDPRGKRPNFAADPRMLFVDEMWIDEKGFLWMPGVQLNRVLIKGGPAPQLPYHVLKVETGQKPVHR